MKVPALVTFPVLFYFVFFFAFFSPWLAAKVNLALRPSDHDVAVPLAFLFRFAYFIFFFFFLMFYEENVPHSNSRCMCI